ncbi:hypothetical protein [Bogoriella caseilytica]|nr:hypothetical protein [Bogoriella caseilytica]
MDCPSSWAPVAPLKRSRHRDRRVLQVVPYWNGGAVLLVLRSGQAGAA